MKLNYYPETDSLYIDLSSRSSKESVEVSEGIVLDYDEDGDITGIDIDNCIKVTPRNLSTAYSFIVLCSFFVSAT